MGDSFAMSGYLPYAVAVG